MRREHPDRVLHVPVVGLDADRPQAVGAAEPSRPGDLGQGSDSWVVPPLVHHEEASRSERSESLRVLDVVTERLLDEHGDVVLESLVDDCSVRRDRRDDDERIDGAELGHPRNDRRSASCPRPGDARVGSCQHRHIASERPQVPQDVSAPLPAADQPDDHGPR